MPAHWPRDPAATSKAGADAYHPVLPDLKVIRIASGEDTLVRHPGRYGDEVFAQSP